jgi:hypothetical protein
MLSGVAMVNVSPYGRAGGSIRLELCASESQLERSSLCVESIKGGASALPPSRIQLLDAACAE